MIELVQDKAFDALIVVTIFGIKAAAAFGWF
jgi:hypothetical protein